MGLGLSLGGFGQTRRRSCQGVGLWLAAMACPLAARAADGDARWWLQRIQDAAANRNYIGTLVVSAGGSVSSSRVAHWCEGPQRFERVDMLDGPARQTLRHNDTVKTLWPQTRTALIEQREPVSGFPALPAGDAALAGSYGLKLGAGNDRVAGHEAQQIVFRPLDAWRYEQRLWVERGSGLLLRNDIVNAKGEVLESTAFTDLRIGGKPDGAALSALQARLEGYRVVRANSGRTQLESEGWMVARPVTGFQLVGSLKRPLDLLAASSAGSPPVLQAVFSDGLTHVSVFIEPYDATRHKPMTTTMGAASTTMSQVDNAWITVVGDVPPETAEKFVTALARRR